MPLLHPCPIPVTPRLIAESRVERLIANYSNADAAAAVIAVITSRRSCPPCATTPLEVRPSPLPSHNPLSSWRACNYVSN